MKLQLPFGFPVEPDVNNHVHRLVTIVHNKLIVTVNKVNIICNVNCLKVRRKSS